MLDGFLEDSDRCFTTRWRGYDRAEVESAFATADEELQLACLDRDAALATARDVAAELEALRSEVAEYRLMHAGFDRDNPVSGCMRYLIHMAKVTALAVESEARRYADSLARDAEEMAAKQATLLDETDRECRQRLADAARRAEEIIEAAGAETAERRWTIIPAPRDPQVKSGRHALEVDEVTEVVEADGIR